MAAPEESSQISEKSTEETVPSPSLSSGAIVAGPRTEDVEDMYQQFYTDIRRINYMFSQLTAKVQRKIYASDHDLTHSLEIHVLQMKILSERDEERIRSMYGTERFMKILSKYWSFIDFGPLDSIVDYIGSEHEKEALQTYRRELSAFCQRRIFKSSDSLDDSHTEKRKLQFALDFKDPAVRRIPGKSLKVAIANILDCRASDLTLHDIGSGQNTVIGQEERDDYLAQLYCVYKQYYPFTTCTFDLVVIQNIKSHISAVRQEYEERVAKLCCDLVIEFNDDADCIALDMPLEGMSVQEKWKIAPLTHPVVLKQDIDNYAKGNVIPKCSFSAFQLDENRQYAPPAHLQVQLIGLKSHNFLTFDLQYPGYSIIEKMKLKYKTEPEERMKRMHEREAAEMKWMYEREAEEQMKRMHEREAAKRIKSAEMSSRAPALPILSVEVEGSGVHEPGMSSELYPRSTAKMMEEIGALSGEKSSLFMKEFHKGLIRGVEVCGETCMTVTNSAQFFEWERFGLRVHIEENSLPEDIEQMTIIIKASIAGHYESPKGYDRASAVFWFQCEPNIELGKKVTLEMQHCAISDHSSDLSFARAVCTQETLPYTFQLLKGGEFSNRSSYGVLSLSRFSGIAIFFEMLGFNRRNYYASLFHVTKESNHEVHIVVTWNTNAHLEVVRQKYGNAQPGPEQQIQFESDKISLSIPVEGTKLNGWKIIPLKTPVIKKEDVDNYRPGQGIPSCHLLARIVDQSTIEPLQHTITLDGAKPPNTFFTIFIDPGVQNRNRPDPEPRATCLDDVDSSIVLGVDDLLDVMNEVLSRKASYYALGRALRIEAGELDAVHKQYQSTDFDMALNQVLLLWLRQRYNTTRFGPPSWKMLVGAVDNKAGINDHALAQEIAQKHKR